MKTKILNKTELVHPIFLLIFVGGFAGLINFSLFDFWENDLGELLPSIISVIISYFILNALNTSQVVALKNNEIVKGFYCLPFGFLSIKKRISISDVKEIELKQNEKLFYEIIAESRGNDSLIIKSIANKNPAEKELSRIKSEINTFANNVYLIAIACAHLENSFGIFSGKYLFTKLVAEPRN